MRCARWALVDGLHHSLSFTMFLTNLSVKRSKTSSRLSLVVSSNINHTETPAYFHEIIKRRLQRGADDQSANQRTRLNPNSDSAPQMAKLNSLN